MSQAVTKPDLVAAIAEASGTRLNKADVASVLDAVGRVVRERVAAGQVVNLPGLGRFSERERAPRVGRNPRTGEPVEIDARRVLAFRAGKRKE